MAGTPELDPADTEASKSEMIIALKRLRLTRIIDSELTNNSSIYYIIELFAAAAVVLNCRRNALQNVSSLMSFAISGQGRY